MDFQLIATFMFVIIVNLGLGIGVAYVVCFILDNTLGRYLSYRQRRAEVQGRANRDL